MIHAVTRAAGAGRSHHARRLPTRAPRDMAKVNPKDLKPQVYKDPRPAEYFQPFHDQARKGIGWIFNFVRVILTLPTILLYRARAIGLENVPEPAR